MTQTLVRETPKQKIPLIGRIPIINRMNISDLLIEITRKCNMKCAHCLRGKAQNVDIDLAHVDSFLKQVKTVGELTLTGGEPSLASDKIKGIAKLIKKHHVNVNHFGIVTNGKAVNQDFVDAVNELYEVCIMKHKCGVSISGDKWHENVFRSDNEDNPSQFLSGKLACSLSVKHDWDESTNVLMGEAIGMNTNRFAHLFVPAIDGLNINSCIVLTALGNIVSACELSFNAEDQQENIVCHASNTRIYEALHIYKEKTFPSSSVWQSCQWGEHKVNFVDAKPTA